ncbi:MAG: hypothetical protein QOF78_4296 [Phycisphaerales bacterium]|jgi:hypothetical protein|nr:hypothetical protein [Phycisphaerales bacterium]MEA2736414.1 hypothetical protein [Humisphaera sp.]
MDMSKLPRMSQTPPPPPDEPQQQASQSAAPAAAPVHTAASHYREEHAYAAEPIGGSLAEAWISIAIGLILLFATTAFRLVQYLSSPGTFTWTFNDENGAPIKYTQTVFIWGDAAMLLFSIVLILEGLLLFTRKPGLIALAFGITVLTIAVNLFFLAGMMTRGYGFQLASALAIAFGVYIAIFQWKLLQSLRMSRGRAGA